MTEMHHTFQYPDSAAPIADTDVLIYLIAPGGRPTSGYVDDVQVSGYSRVRTDSTGEITVELPVVDAPDPAVWVAEIQPSMSRRKHLTYFSVPASGPAEINDNIVDPPDLVAWGIIGVGPPGPPGEVSEAELIAAVAAEAAARIAADVLRVPIGDHHIVVDDASFVAAIAAASSGDAIELRADITCAATRSLPAAVAVIGNGHQIHFTNTSGNGLEIDNPSSRYMNFTVDGSNAVTGTLLRLGTTGGGAGAKSLFQSVYTRRCGAGGTARWIHNLQNSVHVDLRDNDHDLAVNVVVLDDGSKNNYFFGLWPTDCPNGYGLWLTTASGTQRSSKNYIWNFLSEGTKGVKCGDSEQTFFFGPCANRFTASSPATVATGMFVFVSDGNRSGSAHGCADATILWGQCKDYDNLLDIQAGAVKVYTGGMTIDSAVDRYKVTPTTARIYEIFPHLAVSGNRFSNGGGSAVERTVLPGHVGLDEATDALRLVAIPIAVGDETTAITTGTAKVTFRMPFAMKVTAVRASLTTASSSGNPTFDINEAGVSILGTKLSIDSGEKTSTTAASAATITDADLADDAEITIDIDTAGTGATGPKVYLIGPRQ